MAYVVRRSRRAKYMRLTVRPGGAVIVTAPERFPPSMIEKFASKHASWIARAVERMRHLKAIPGGRKELNAAPA
ncbi:MAG: YgjP-like metallopeptidase domain-containing protein, partial [Minisyncoccia bacterium]